MAGTIVANTLNTDTVGGVFTTANAVTGIPKAWVRFAGTTGTVASSFNVSAVTRASTGVYTITFSTAMANANYCATVSASTSAAPSGILTEIFTNSSQVATAPSTSSFVLGTLTYNAGAFADPTYVNVAVFSS